jgi:hypothetical protein
VRPQHDGGSANRPGDPDRQRQRPVVMAYNAIRLTERKAAVEAARKLVRRKRMPQRGGGDRRPSHSREPAGELTVGCFLHGRQAPRWNASANTS